MPGFQCQACNISLNSQEQLQQHRTGRKHLNKVKEKGIGLAPEKEPSPSKAPRLYGTFVLPSDKKTVTENVTPIPLNVNEFEDKPLYPPPPPPPPSFLLSQGGPAKSRTATLSNGTPMPCPVSTSSSPPPPPPPPKKVQNQTGGFTLPSGMNPVMKTVVNNALGNLPLKRKLYSSKCEACNLVFNAESQEKQHYSGKKHAKKMRMMQIEKKTEVPNTPVLQCNGFVCQFCDLVLNSIEQMEQHRLGTKHQKKVAAAMTKQSGIQPETLEEKTDSEIV